MNEKKHTSWWQKWSHSDEGVKILAFGGNTAPVGAFKGDVSFFQCFDMGGNAREWVNDWYRADYYKTSPKNNPCGPTEDKADYVTFGKASTGRCRVLRGACWYNFQPIVCTSKRARSLPKGWDYRYGFRCAADYPWNPPERTAEAVEGTHVLAGKSGESGTTPPSHEIQNNFDGVYVAKAATGDPIPHPLSRKTYKIIYKGKRIDVPEDMIFIPPGRFLMGRTSQHEEFGLVQIEVYLDGYFISKYEVTNAEYWEFVKATGHRMPKHWIENGGKIPEGRENHPVAHMTWEDAKAYCDWCGKRIPTEAEWEKAAGWGARDKKQRNFPWGDEYGPHRANDCYEYGCRCDNNYGKHKSYLAEWQKTAEGRKIMLLGGNTAAVGSFKGDVSFFGCLDMGGNLKEWVADWYRADYYKVGPRKNPKGPTEAEATPVNGKKIHVVRGGYWFNMPGGMQTASRNRFGPYAAGLANGFRCAADYPFVPEAM